MERQIEVSLLGSSATSQVHDDRLGHNFTDALFYIGESLHDIAVALQNLGNGNASTQMGAVENLAKEMRDGFILMSDAVSGGLNEIALTLPDAAEAMKVKE